MSTSLAEKIRKSREKGVPVGGFDFTIRRPTDLDMMEFSKSRQPADLVRFVVGWDKVKELDLLPGGDGHPVPFDADACSEWLADRTDLMVPLINAITEEYQAHKQRQEAAAKN
jgi:hypothetical protein